MRNSIRTIEPLETRVVPASLPTLDFSSLGGVFGFEIISPAGISGFERIGDFNKDGVEDLLIFSLSAGNGAGAAYVVYGKSGGFPSSINLSQLDGTNGFSIAGEASGDKFGRGAAAGDVNNDGFADLIIGAPGANNGGDDRGSAYVIFGRAITSPTLALASLGGTTGFKITGGADNDYLGFRVAGNGDFNGDGFDDLIVGAPLRDSFSSNAGAAYVIYGKGSGFSAALNVSALDGTNGFAIGSSTDRYLGSYVRFIGDLDRDGRDEISIGEAVSSVAPSLTGDMTTFDLRFNEGEDETGHVLFGSATSPASAIDIATNTAVRSFALNDTTKYQISSIASRMQDFTGDGIPDFVVSGADARNTPTGINLGLIIVPGKANAPFTENPLTQRGAKVLARLIDIPNGPGRFSFDTGDFNGDGFPDFVIDRAGDAGAELYFGSKLGGYSLVGKSRTDQGIAFTGLSNAQTQTLKFAGDLNGDGFDDLIATTPAEGGGVKASVVFGTGLRISPNGKSATFLDADGDLVTVQTNKGAFDYTQFITSRPVGAVSGGVQLDTLALANHAEFAGASITISIKRGPVSGQGDLKVVINRIDATGLDLGAVAIAGRLGEIDSGDSTFTTSGLKSLTVDSFAFLSPGTSEVAGSIGSLTVRGNWNNQLMVTGQDAGIRSVQIGGDFTGGLQMSGALGAFKSRDFQDGSSLITGTNLSTSDRLPSTALTFREVGAATISIGGPISVLKAVQVDDAIISADRLASLLVSGDKRAGLRGDFTGTVTLDNGGVASSKIALGSAKIAGLVSDSSIIVQGSVGSFAAAAMTDSHLYAGYTPTDTGTPLSGGNFVPGATLNAFTISGKATVNSVAMDNSYVVAGSMGAVKAASADTANGGTVWGFGFQTKVKSLKVTTPAFSYSVKTGGTQASGNFTVTDLV